MRVDVQSSSLWFLVPGRWGTLQVSAENSSAEPANLLITTGFTSDDNLRFGRRIWVPPRARVRTSHPVLAPPPTDPDQQSFAYRTLLFDADAATGTPVRQEWGRPQLDGAIRIGRDDLVTVIVDPPSTSPRAHRDMLVEVVQAARYERNLWRNVVTIGNQALPHGELALDAVDHLVVADDRLKRDLSTLAAVREWVSGGGRLWVMLDRVDAALLEALFGDEFGCEVVDRISLTSVTIAPGPAGTGDTTFSTSHEVPVDFVRVLTSGAQIEYEVDGWPAAFWIDCGEGRVLVTTLAADAWVRPRTPDDTLPRVGDLQDSQVIPGRPLEQVAMSFFVPKAVSPLPPLVAEEHVRQSVGYSIPSRSVVLGMMSAFVFMLAALGHWLSRSGRLEWMGVAGPAGALLFGIAIAVAGHWQRRDVDASVAALQLVRPIPGTGDVRITAAAAVFSSDAGTTRIAGTRGGWLLPAMEGMEDTARRLVRTDLDAWQWEDVPHVPGLRTATLLESHRPPDPVRAELELDRTGIVGRLSLPAGLAASDGVIAAPFGRIGVEFAEDGTVRAPADHVLSDEQFLTAGILSDEQARRTRTLQSVLSGTDGEHFPREPMLLFWTDPWDLGMRVDDHSGMTGAALVVMPLNLRRPAEGTEFTIPAPLLPYRETVGPDGAVPTGFFNARQRAWTSKRNPTSSWLQFQVPESLLPIQPQSAQVLILVSGPVGKLSISGAGEGQAVPIRTWTDPVGRLELTIDDPRFLSLTDDGRLLLHIAGGDPDRPELTFSAGDGAADRVSYWQIESLSLQLSGVVPISSE